MNRGVQSSLWWDIEDFVYMHRYHVVFFFESFLNYIFISIMAMQLVLPLPVNRFLFSHTSSSVFPNVTYNAISIKILLTVSIEP